MTSPKDNSHQVRKAHLEDIDALTSVLIRAFEDDPQIQWFVRSDSQHHQAMAQLFRMLMEGAIRNGNVYTTEELKGAALWHGPQNWRFHPLKQLMHFAKMRTIIGAPFLATRFWGIQRIEHHHPKNAHHYLQILGTDPEFQGQGIGSALLKPILDICDQHHVPAYLENSKEFNIPFYEGHGFRIQKNIKMPTKGPQIWLMWINPKENQIH